MSQNIPKRLERAAFPFRVSDLPEPPKQLFLVGQLPRGPAVAIVGTRKPTREAVAYTAELVESLGEHGVAIWSGGAVGIDVAAHEAALRVGAPTVVVAPAGWDRPYPPQHAELYRAIVAQGGAYLSQVAPERPAQQHLFFARNALLVALAQVVVIVQAGLRSGARNAAKFARALGRPLFAAPSCPWVYQGLGCNVELGLGARILTSPKDVIRSIHGQGLVGFVDSAKSTTVSATSWNGFDCVPPVSASEALKEGGAGFGGGQNRKVRRGPTSQSDALLDGELECIVSAIRSGANTVDALCAGTGLALSVVQSGLLRLTLLGLVRTDRTGVVCFVTNR
jgi:DNA processing protein